MSEIIEIVVNGQQVYFESAETLMSETEKVGGISNVSAKIADSFDKALETTKAIAIATIENVRSFDQRIAPDEFQLQFGIKLSAEFGAVITKAVGEAQLAVTFTYKHEKRKQIRQAKTWYAHH